MHRTLRSALVGLASAAVVAGALAAPASADSYGDFYDAGPSCAAVASGTPADPATNQAPVAKNDTARVVRGGTVVLNVLRNDTDPDGDALALLGASQPKYGETCLVDNKIFYFSYGIPGSRHDTFTYTVGDGDRYTTAKVFISLTSLRTKLPQVTRKLATSHGKVTRYARVLLTNPDPDFGVRYLVGDPRGEKADKNVYLKSGISSEFGTPRRGLIYISYVGSNEYSSLTGIGDINTVTGKVRPYSIEEFRASPEAMRLAARL